MMDKILDVVIGWPAALVISIAVWIGAKIWTRQGK